MSFDVEAFIASLEAYYGGNDRVRYNQAQRDAITGWLRQRDWSRGFAAQVYHRLLETFSARYGRLPAIAELEEARQSVLGDERYAHPELADRTEEMRALPDSGEMDHGDLGAYLSRLTSIMREGKNPRDVIEFDENGLPK